MREHEAVEVARRLWGDNGRAVRGPGRCLIGVVRTDGSWAAYYIGRDWSSVIRRAMSNKPYDGPGPRLIKAEVFDLGLYGEVR